MIRSGQTECQTSDEHDQTTPYDWFEYEFASVEYDHRISPMIGDIIRDMAKRLYHNTLQQNNKQE